MDDLKYMCVHCEKGGFSRDEVTEFSMDFSRYNPYGYIKFICNHCKSGIKNFQVEDD